MTRAALFVAKRVLSLLPDGIGTYDQVTIDMDPMRSHDSVSVRVTRGPRWEERLISYDETVQSIQKLLVKLLDDLVEEAG